MNRTIAIAKRVLAQLRHDHRTMALILLVPSLLLVIFKYVFNGQERFFESFAPVLFGVFPLVLMFIVTSIAMLRERRTGTLERLMTMPISKFQLISGYMLSFSVLAFAQVLLACAVMMGLLGVSVVAPLYLVVLVALFAAWLGTALGLFVSAFAESEFQAVQFMPALLFPQLLVCGMFAPRDQMAEALQWFSNILPLTYSVDAMKYLVAHSGWSGQLVRDLLVVAGFTVTALVLGSITIRRQQK